MNKLWRNTVLTVLALLLGITATVLCAVPIVMATITYGTDAVPGTHSSPFIKILIDYKFWVFLAVGIVLLLIDWLTKTIPDDTSQTVHDASYMRLVILNHRLFWLSVLVWAVGLYCAYLAIPIAIMLVY